MLLMIQSVLSFWLPLEISNLKFKQSIHISVIIKRKRLFRLHTYKHASINQFRVKIVYSRLWYLCDRLIMKQIK